MRYIFILIASLLLFGCKVIHPKKDYEIVSVWTVPFENMYYASPRMSNIKHYKSEVGYFGKRIDDRKLFLRLNNFLENVDTCKIDTSFSEEEDPFVEVLIEFRKKESDSIVQIGVNDVGMFIYNRITYYTNDSLVKMIQPYIKSTFRTRVFAEED